MAASGLCDPELRNLIIIGKTAKDFTKAKKKCSVQRKRVVPLSHGLMEEIQQ